MWHRRTWISEPSFVWVAVRSGNNRPSSLTPATGFQRVATFWPGYISRQYRISTSSISFLPSVSFCPLSSLRWWILTNQSHIKVMTVKVVPWVLQCLWYWVFLTMSQNWCYCWNWYQYVSYSTSLLVLAFVVHVKNLLLVESWDVFGLLILSNSSSLT